MTIDSADFAHTPWIPLEADHARWLESTPLMDLADTKLRLRVQSLTQLRRAPRERAIALYGYVKVLPLVIPAAFGVRTARNGRARVIFANNPPTANDNEGLHG